MIQIVIGISGTLTLANEITEQYKKQNKLLTQKDVAFLYLGAKIKTKQKNDEHNRTNAPTAKAIQVQYQKYFSS